MTLRGPFQPYFSYILFIHFTLEQDSANFCWCGPRVATQLLLQDASLQHELQVVDPCVRLSLL